jgi:hypothetical protein
MVRVGAADLQRGARRSNPTLMLIPSYARLVPCSSHPVLRLMPSHPPISSHPISSHPTLITPVACSSIPCSSRPMRIPSRPMLMLIPSHIHPMLLSQELNYNTALSSVSCCHSACLKHFAGSSTVAKALPSKSTRYQPWPTMTQSSHPLSIRPIALPVASYLALSAVPSHAHAHAPSPPPAIVRPFRCRAFSPSRSPVLTRSCYRLSCAAARASATTLRVATVVPTTRHLLRTRRAARVRRGWANGRPTMRCYARGTTRAASSVGATTRRTCAPCATSARATSSCRRGKAATAQRVPWLDARQDAVSVTDASGSGVRPRRSEAVRATSAVAYRLYNASRQSRAPLPILVA